jgi:hypothetical protein
MSFMMESLSEEFVPMLIAKAMFAKTVPVPPRADEETDPARTDPFNKEPPAPLLAVIGVPEASAAAPGVATLEPEALPGGADANMKILSRNLAHSCEVR